MDVIEQIHAHRSVRNFQDRAIPPAVMEQILTCASRAPSGGVLQLYSIVVTSEPSRREVLAALHFGAEAIRSAAAVLTFCIDTNRLGRWLALSGEEASFENAWGMGIGFSDALLAAQNAALAAESLGLGTCFLGTTFAASPTLSRFLECPPHVLPVATLILGYPSDPAESHTTSRLPLSAMVHSERYESKSDGELQALYAEHARATFEMFKAQPSLAPAIQALGLENLAAYYARFSYPADVIELASCFFGAAASSQGFGGSARLARTSFTRSALSDAALAGLPIARQLVFALALAMGALDARVNELPSSLEAELFELLNARDPSFYDDFTKLSVFHPGVRARLRGVLQQEKWLKAAAE